MSFLGPTSVVTTCFKRKHLILLAATTLKFSVYVDDIITGANTIDEVCTLEHELIRLLCAGDFELRKWMSSHEEVLRDAPYEHQESPLVFDNDDSYVKFLSMMWGPGIHFVQFPYFWIHRPYYYANHSITHS